MELVRPERVTCTVDRFIESVKRYIFSVRLHSLLGVAVYIQTTHAARAETVIGVVVDIVVAAVTLSVGSELPTLRRLVVARSQLCNTEPDAKSVNSELVRW